MKNAYAREIKGYTNHPTLMDTEPTVTEIYSARGVRKERERKFDRSRLHPGGRNTDGYLDSIKEEIHIRSRALAYQLFEIGKLLVDAKDLLPLSKSSALNFCRVYKICMV